MTSPRYKKSIHFPLNRFYCNLQIFNMQKFILEKSLSLGNILHKFLIFRKFQYILILEECTSDLILFVFTNCLVVCFNCSKSSNNKERRFYRNCGLKLIIAVMKGQLFRQLRRPSNIIDSTKCFLQLCLRHRETCPKTRQGRRFKAQIFFFPSEGQDS